MCRHLLLRQQLSLHRALLQLVSPAVARAASVTAQSRRCGSRGGGYGEMHVLHPTHQTEERGGGSGASPTGRWRGTDRLCPVLSRGGDGIWRSQRRKQQGEIAKYH